MCLDLVLECQQWFFQIFMILLQLLLLFPVTQLKLIIGCADSAYHLHFYLIEEIQPKGFGSSEALSGDQRILLTYHLYAILFSYQSACLRHNFPPLPSFIGQRYKQKFYRSKIQTKQEVPLFMCTCTCMWVGGVGGREVFVFVHTCMCVCLLGSVEAAYKNLYITAI